MLLTQDGFLSLDEWRRACNVDPLLMKARTPSRARTHFSPGTPAAPHPARRISSPHTHARTHYALQAVTDLFGGIFKLNDASFVSLMPVEKENK